MGAFLDKPECEKHREAQKGNGLSSHLSSMQGWRVDQEDAHCMHIDLKTDDRPGWSVFGVFDGHGGKMNSIRSAKMVKDEFIHALPATATPTKDQIAAAFATAFGVVDVKLRAIEEHAMAHGEPCDTSGCTAICALVTKTHIFVANAGDSRSVLCRAGKAVAMSFDHKPTNPAERSRISDPARGNGFVQAGRVDGELAVSRALGDFKYKTTSKRVGGKVIYPADLQKVSCVPDIEVQERTSSDEFLVIACDGIWDVMKNQECVSFVKEMADKAIPFSSKPGSEDDEGICDSLLMECLELGSRDNMSVVVVDFAGR